MQVGLVIVMSKNNVLKWSLGLSSYRLVQSFGIVNIGSTLCGESYMLLRLIIVLAVCLPSSSVLARCTKDTECKGSRICHKGMCRAPFKQSARRPNAKARTSGGQWSAAAGVSFMYIGGRGMEWNSAPGVAVYYEKNNLIGVAEGYIGGVPLTGLSVGGGYKLDLPFGSLGLMGLVGAWEGRVQVEDTLPSISYLPYSPVVQTAFLWVQPYLRLGDKFSLVLRPRLGIIGLQEDCQYSPCLSQSAAAAGFTADIAYKF